jgi:hypothetical protein
LFDVVSALAGLAVLVVLGPAMLYQTVTTPIPAKGELTIAEGIVLTCHGDFRGALVRIAGYPREFRTLLDSCSKVLPEIPGGAVRISVYAPLSEVNEGRRRGAIHSFGLIADGGVVHERDADLTAARLDRVVLTMSGVIATVALGCLGWVAASDQEGAMRLFTGRDSR